MDTVVANRFDTARRKAEPADLTGAVLQASSTAARHPRNRYAAGIHSSAGNERLRLFLRLIFEGACAPRAFEPVAVRVRAWSVSDSGPADRRDRHSGRSR